MGKSTISMAIFNSYVCLSEGIFWHSIRQSSDILLDMFSDTLSHIFMDILSDILFDSLSGILSDILSDSLSGISGILSGIRFGSVAAQKAAKLAIEWLCRGALQVGKNMAFA